MAAVSSSAEYNRMKELKEFDETKMGVKGLADSGITTIPKFFVQMPEVRSTLKPCSKDHAGIPLIDLSRMNSPDHRPRIVDELREAAKNWGFFQVINHGVPVSVLNKTIESIKSFHEQPQELKAKHYVRTEQSGVMYASNNDLFRSKAASWHDFVHVWMSPEPADVDQIPDACRSEIVAWDKEATMVAEMVAELLSEGLGVAAGKLREAGLLATKTIAGVYYPFCPQPDITLGLNHHTDPGVLTVLLENQVVGLQVKHGGEWVDVKPVPGSLIINIGDALQIISNGEYISVEHRVLANSSNEPRISIVEFFNMDKRVESRRYGPLPELVTPESPARYRNFTVKEFHDNFFSKGLDSKSLVEKLMV
ncbi:hypothetical protein RHSIM_Rhsim03G0073400 [Rhododendron simsii]|uniref:Fe2OG dioxygenase domain-containing protein n=1 Tax=Rhododendron simsii TaxID=118357 RepID=A0A834H6Y3_RHOSS|nr:hypothetical protein RHSIM_Rhsim03G0073400 [Rhododendron simsii]